MNELPSISTTTYTSSLLHSPELGAFHAVAGNGFCLERRVNPERLGQQEDYSKLLEAANQLKPKLPVTPFIPKEIKMTTRLVKVIIADPNDNLPLESRLLYNGPEHLTDMTDQDLYFDLEISALLKKHNVLRATTLDKKATEKSGRDVFLEPLRVSGLKMIVVNIATF